MVHGYYTLSCNKNNNKEIKQVRFTSQTFKNINILQVWALGWVVKLTLKNGECCYKSEKVSEQFQYNNK